MPVATCRSPPSALFEPSLHQLTVHSVLISGVRRIILHDASVCEDAGGNPLICLIAGRIQHPAGATRTFRRNKAEE